MWFVSYLDYVSSLCVGLPHQYGKPGYATESQITNKQNDVMFAYIQTTCTVKMHRIPYKAQTLEGGHDQGRLHMLHSQSRK